MDPIAMMQESQTSTPITDKLLRSVLIKSCEAMEMMIKNGTATNLTRGKTERDCGLRVDMFINQPKTDKPAIYTIEYIVDPLKLSAWIESPAIAWMHDSGPLVFNVMGIRCWVPPKPQYKSNADVGFAIDTEHGTIHLDLIKKAARFRVHRDVISGSEWVVSYVQPED